MNPLLIRTHYNSLFLLFRIAGADGKFNDRYIEDREMIYNPNIVKVVTDKQNYALYFSRSVIPFNRDSQLDVKYYRHIGVYPIYRNVCSNLYLCHPQS